MLKIKDNVDLRELEKFGFRIEQDDKEFASMNEDNLFDNYYCTLAYKPLGSNYYLIVQNDEYSREINIVPQNNIPFKVTLTFQLEALYDLITAGLVEKVDG